GDSRPARLADSMLDPLTLHVAPYSLVMNHHQDSRSIPRRSAVASAKSSRRIALLTASSTWNNYPAGLRIPPRTHMRSSEPTCTDHHFMPGEFKAEAPGIAPPLKTKSLSSRISLHISCSLSRKGATQVNTT